MTLRCCGWLPDKIFKVLCVRQYRQYRISWILSQSVQNNRFTECYRITFTCFQTLRPRKRGFLQENCLFHIDRQSKEPRFRLLKIEASTVLYMRKLSLQHRSIIERASISITQNRGKCGVIQNRGKCGVIHTNFSNEFASHSPDTFLLYANKLDSMASSLESLMAHRLAKKAARSCGIINHNLTANHLNQHINNTNQY